MATWTCEQCGDSFNRNRSGKRPIRFCSQTCYHRWSREFGDNVGRFQNGFVPWNKNTRGVMKSNSGSFKSGRASRTKLPKGSVTIRLDKRGSKRAWVKIASKGDIKDWQLRAVVVWEGKHGSLPIGKIIHHKDRNTLNDKVYNLQAVTRAEHLAEHRPEFEEKRKQAASRANKKRHAKNRAV